VEAARSSFSSICALASGSKVRSVSPVAGLMDAMGMTDFLPTHYPAPANR
jgi:hypothetical protein